MLFGEKNNRKPRAHQNVTALTAFLLATCLRVEDVDAILVFLGHGLPVQVRQSSGCVGRLHDVGRLHHLRQDRNPAWGTVCKAGKAVDWPVHLRHTWRRSRCLIVKGVADPPDWAMAWWTLSLSAKFPMMRTMFLWIFRESLRS